MRNGYIELLRENLREHQHFFSTAANLYEAVSNSNMTEEMRRYEASFTDLLLKLEDISPEPPRACTIGEVK